MSIDWFTVIAQIINFLILVWLLKRFLYRPILDALDARESRIAKTLADAADKQQQAQQQQLLFAQKNREFAEQRETLMAKAHTAVAAERQRLLEEAKHAADKLSSQRRESLHQEQHRLNAEISRKTQKEVLAITRQALRELANADLEEQIVKVFLARLQTLDNDSRTTLNSAHSTTAESLRVRSSFALQETQQKRISKAINEVLNGTRQINFETTPEIISGIELTVNGRKLAWSIAQYIDSLEKHLQQLVQQSSGQKAERQDE